MVESRDGEYAFVHPDLEFHVHESEVLKRKGRHTGNVVLFRAGEYVGGGFSPTCRSFRVVEPAHPQVVVNNSKVDFQYPFRMAVCIQPLPAKGRQIDGWRLAGPWSRCEREEFPHKLIHFAACPRVRMKHRQDGDSQLDVDLESASSHPGFDLDVEAGGDVGIGPPGVQGRNRNFVPLVQTIVRGLDYFYLQMSGNLRNRESGNPYATAVRIDPGCRSTRRPSAARGRRR